MDHTKGEKLDALVVRQCLMATFHSEPAARGAAKHRDVGCGDEIGRAIFLEEGRQRQAKPLVIGTSVVLCPSEC